jgi:hypothetical protein
VGSILNDADRTAIRQRINSVTSASVPRWGRMDAKAMLTHLRQSAAMSDEDEYRELNNRADPGLQPTAWRIMSAAAETQR